MAVARAPCVNSSPWWSSTTSDALKKYLTRGDFSRWIRDVFGDHALASELRAQEERYRRGDDLDILPKWWRQSGAATI